MTVRRSDFDDLLIVERFFLSHAVNRRLYDIIHEAMAIPGDGYIAALSLTNDEPDMIAAYGMVAGALGTGALYGVVPISNRITELLSFAAHDLQSRGAQRIVAEFPDTEEFKPYRDVLLESGFDPTGMVDDFYRDGTAMVIFTRVLSTRVQDPPLLAGGLGQD